MLSMKKRFIEAAVAVCFIVLVLIAAGSVSYAESSWKGSGTEEQPYLIGSYDELLALSSAVKMGENYSGSYFKLTSDIQLQDDWQPVGALAEGETSTGKGVNLRPFSGNFDGGGFTVTSAAGGKAIFGYVREAEIHDLCIAGSDIRGSGLIGNYTIDYGPSGTGFGVHTATVTNVTIKSGTNIEGSGIVSGLAAGGNTVDIINCTVEPGVVVGSSKDKDRKKVGSFGGEFNGTVTGCTSAATVYGTDYVGGIIGCKGQTLCDTRVTGCTFTGKVIASGTYAGGIAGGGYGGHANYGIESAPNGVMLTVESCLSLGKVTASDVAGGIIGYETTVQPWNDSFVRANLFAGKITVPDGACSGAIVGAFRGMDKCSIIEGNYFAEGCGADRGIGKVQYLDTSCETHETVYGENYFDSSKKNIPVFPGVNDTYQNLRANYNRTDDPLGADVDNVAKKVTEEELKNGSVTELLNEAPGSLKNWVQGESTPVIEGEPVRPDDPDEPSEEEKEREARKEAIRDAAALLLEVEKYDDQEAVYTEASYSAFSSAEEMLLTLMTNASSKAADIRSAMDDLKQAAAALEKRKAQPMTVKVTGAKAGSTSGKKTYKASALKKKARKFTAYTVKKAEGTLTYKITGNARSKKALRLDKKTGRITVKRSTKKGTYKLKVKITASGNGTYLPGSKTVTVTVKVR